MRILAVVAHGAIIGDVRASIRTESHDCRTVEPGGMVGADECLVSCDVPGEAQDLQCNRLIPLLNEVDQLDLVSDFGRRLGGIRRREAEIAFERIQHRTSLDRPAHE